MMTPEQEEKADKLRELASLKQHKKEVDERIEGLTSELTKTAFEKHDHFDFESFHFARKVSKKYKYSGDVTKVEGYLKDMKKEERETGVAERSEGKPYILITPRKKMTLEASNNTQRMGEVESLVSKRQSGEN